MEVTMSRFVPPGLRLFLIAFLATGLLGGVQVAYAAAPVISDVTSPKAFTPPSGSLTLIILANDADGDNITLSFDPAMASDLNPTPNGATPAFTQTVNDPGHAEASFTWANPAETDKGIAFSARIHATDGTNAAEDSFTIFINRPPSLDPISTQSIDEGAALSVTPSVSDPDQNSGPPTSMTYNGANLPSGASVNASTGVLSWSPTGAQAGTYSNVTITADDGLTGQSSQSFTINVTDPSVPAVAAISNQTVAEGATLSLTASATDSDNDALTYSLTNAPSGMTINASTGAIAWLPDYTQAGSYTGVVVHASDGTNDGTTSFNVTVTNTNRAPTMNAIANQMVAENAALTVTPSANDPDNDALAWSGTNMPPGASVNASTGVLTWTPGYTQAGTYSNVTITADDGNGGTASQSFQITVTNVNDPPVVASIANQTVAENAALTVTPSATDADSDPLTWSGANLPSGASVNASTGEFTWTPDYSQAGSYSNVTLTANDGVSGNGSASFDITVTNTNRAPTMNSIANQTVAENAALTVTPSASDPDNDALAWSGTNMPTGASVNASTGVLTWTPSYSQAGTYSNVTLTADDGNGGTASQAFDITVTNVNQPPTIASIANQTVAENAVLTVTPSASDGDGDALAWSGTNLPSGASVNASTGEFTWTPGYTQAGSYSAVTLTADDGNGGTASQAFDITVTNVNRAPTIASIANQTVAENAALTVTPSANDPDNDVLAWSGTNMPTGASVNASTGVLTWTPGYTQAGTYSNVTLTADDGNGGTASQAFDITVTNVNDPPVVASIANQTVAENAALTVTPSATDADSDPLTWSGANLPSGASVNASTGEFTWTPDYTQAGTYSNVTLTANDGVSGNGSASFDITVTNVNRAPTVNSIANQTVNEGSLLSVTPSASDPDSDPLTWSGTNLPSGASVNASTGEFTWTPNFSQAGTYSNVTLTADDGNGGTASAMFTITVNSANGPPTIASIANQTVAENALLTVTPSASDPDGDPLTWSGTNLPAGASVNASTGELTWTPDYTQAGSYANVTLTADDGNGGTASQAFDITVTNVNRAPTVNTIANQTVAENAALTVTPSASDPDNDVLAWSGTNVPSGASVNASTGEFTWTPSYSQAGSYSAVTLTADDGNGGTASQSFDITVTNVNQPPTIASIPDQTVEVNMLLTVTPSASDGDGDALAWSGTNIPAGASVNASTGVLTWTPNAGDVGSYPNVALTADDGNGGTASQSFMITVSAQVNDPPVVQSIPNQTVAENALLTVTPSANDPNGDPLTWSGANMPAGASVNASTGEFTWTPNFSQAGTYSNVTLTASDGSSSASASFDITVTNVNRQPSMNSVANQTVNEAQPLSVSLSGSDPDNDALTFSLVSIAPAPVSGVQPIVTGTSSTTATLTWTPTYLDANVYTLQVGVVDGNGGTAQTSFTVTVTNVSSGPPVITQKADTSIAEAVVSNIGLLAIGAGNQNNLRWNLLSPAPPWASLTGSQGPTNTLVLRPGFASAESTGSDGVGRDFIRIRVRDGAPNNSPSDTMTFVLTITDTNRSPVLATITNKFVAENATLSFTASAVDPDQGEGDAVSYSLAQAPAGATINATTGQFSWTPDFNANDRVTNGLYGGIQVIASDMRGGSDTETFQIIVANANQSPTLASIAPMTIGEGQLLTFTAMGSDADTLSTITYSLTGDASGAAMDQTTGVFTWTPDFNASQTNGGVYNETATVTDNRGATASQSFQITVTNVNDPPVVQSIPNQTIAENALLTVTPSATDADGDALTWSGTNLPTGASVNASTGELTWTPDYTQAGTYNNVTLTASDGISGSSSASFTISVTNVNRMPTMDAIADQTVMEAQLLTVTPVASDPDNDVMTWSGANLPTGASVNASTGVFTWTPSVSQSGDYPGVTILVDDGQGGTASQSFAITVTEADNPPVVNAIPDQTVNENELLTVTASGSDPDSDPLTWSGTNLPTGAMVDANTGMLTWTPDYTQAGTYANVAIVASDGRGGSAQASFTITVTDINRVPTVQSIPDQTVTEGQLLTVTPSANDPDNDALTWTGSNIPTGASVNATTGVFTWTPSQSQGGTYSNVTLTADDGKGGVASASFSITVNAVNTPPSVASIGNQLTGEGTLLTITPSASDADGDVLTWSGSNLPAGAVVNASTGVFTWTPGYDQAGAYPNVTLTADDGHGGTGSTSFLIVVQNVNGPPAVQSISDQTVAENVQLTVTPSASDPDNDVITWSGANLPAGATVNASTGVFMWTPGYGDAGTYPNVTLIASDGISGTGSASFTIVVTNVNRAPVVNAIPAQTVSESNLLTVTPVANDPDGDVLTWSGTVPTGASVDAATGAFTWTPGVNAGELNGGSYPVTLTVDDGNGGTGSAAFTITVVDLPPVIQSTSTSACANQVKIVGLQASDDDGGAISWAQTGLPAWAVLNGNAGTLTISAPADAYGQSFTGTLTATDVISGQSSSGPFTINVDCTPVAVVNAMTTPVLNRHRVDATPYWLTFEMVGEVQGASITTQDVALEHGGSQLSADANAGITREGSRVTVGFSKQALADLLADVRSGEQTTVTLHVRTDGEELVAPVEITVTGLAIDARLRALPTPFHGSTIVEYVVPEDSPVAVSVYGADGRLVRTLAHGQMSAGIYRVRWDGKTDAGTQAPAGVYYLRGTLGASPLTSRIVMTR
jgi:hypothetical protein